MIKVVVAGPFGAGKTTFVTAASSGMVLSSESDVSDATKALKDNTTVAMDHGIVEDVAPGVSVSLIGTPGQERFTFMWPILAEGMDAYVMLVDASRLQSAAQLKRAVRFFGELDPDAPYVIAANRWDESSMTRDELAEFLAVDPDSIVSCDPRSPAECRALLGQMVEIVEACRAQRERSGVS